MMKVFCITCASLLLLGDPLCAEAVVDTPFAPLFVRCADKNKGNDCGDYECLKSSEREAE